MMAFVLLAAAALPPGPVDFKAQDMRIEPNEHRVVLNGDVNLKRADLVVTGEHAVAEYAQAKSAPKKAKKKARKPAEAMLGGEAVERFTVDGKVHVQRGARTADGERGVLDVPGQTLVLTGTADSPPVLRDGSETLSGERIVLRLDNEDVDVTNPRLVLHRSVPAEDAAAAKGATPVKVEAARLQLFNEKRLAQFREDVVVRRGDTVVKSPRMDARYDRHGQLTRLEMRGGVDMRQGERRATGQNADYDAVRKLLVLTGDPRLYDRGDVLAGDRIDVALESKEVRVERAKGRLHPEQHKEERR